jgi:hypothetical protein
VLAQRLIAHSCSIATRRRSLTRARCQRYAHDRPALTVDRGALLSIETFACSRHPCTREAA